MIQTASTDAEPTRLRIHVWETPGYCGGAIVEGYGGYMVDDKSVRGWKRDAAAVAKDIVLIAVSFGYPAEHARYEIVLIPQRPDDAPY